MGLDFPRVPIPGQRPKLAADRPAEQSLQRLARCLGQLPDGQNPDLGQPGPGHRTDSPHELHREVVQKVELGVWLNDDQTIRLGDLGCNLGQVLGPGHADRDRQTDFCSNPGSDGAGHVGRRTEQMDRSANIGEGFVDRNPLDERGEVAHDVDGGIAEPLVLLVVAADELQVWAQLAGEAPRHAAADSKRLGFVGRRQHHSTADGNRFPAQRRIEELLDRCIEGIEIGMENGGRRCHGHTLVEHMFGSHIVTRLARNELRRLSARDT